MYHGIMKNLRIAGWAGTVVGIASLLLCLLTLIDNDPRHKGAPYGFAMFAILFGLPGGVILWRLNLRRREQEFRAQLLGYIKSHDAFTAEELARKIGRTEMETEALIASVSQQEGVDLVFHRKDRQYMHRKRLRTGHTVLSRCPSCGAALGNQIIFEGEHVTCEYCDHPLMTDAV